jgi:hypothetical protein
MAKGKSKRGEKTATIREMILRNTGAGNQEVAEMVTAKGYTCTAQDVANVKTKLNKGRRGRKKALSADDLMKVKELAQQAGGLSKLTESIASLENIASSVGGLDRLKLGIRHLNQLMVK